ncbi:MAG: hypothetical protein JWN53_990 [Gemmatimonadetes bacterium]|jgi:hypothetical protein|nr:hypothetical protein [Gemmatimonadota bacterium]
MKNSIARSAAALALTITAGASAGAQLPMPHAGVGIVGSSLGLGGDVYVGLGRFIAVRASRSAGSIGVDQTLQAQAYNLFAKADNRSLMVDIHPFGGGIYLSAGKVQNHSTITLTGQPTNGSYTFNGQSYAADSVGTVSGAIHLPQNPTFLGLGWDHTFGNAWPMSLVSRFGVLRQDAATLDLSASGPYGQASNPAHASFQAQLDAERTRQEQTLNQKSVMKNLPVVELGIRLRLF